MKGEPTNWIPAKTPPKTGQVKNAALDDGETVAAVYFNGEWRYLTGSPIEATVEFWADLPRHPRRHKPLVE